MNFLFKIFNYIYGLPTSHRRNVSNRKVFVEETYDSLVWWEDTPKPTDEDILAYYESCKTEWVFIQMKFKRNMLLVECDYCALPDFPNRDQWVVYRELLRDLPANWTIDTPFPQPPT